VTWSHPQSETERQQTVNNFGCFSLDNPKATLRKLPIIEGLVAFIGNIRCVNTATPPDERQQSVNKASTQRQQRVNTVSTILGVASYIIQGLCYGLYP
jgi:hypothetical protein